MSTHEIVPGMACEICESCVENTRHLICESCASSLKRRLRNGDADARKTLLALGMLCESCDGAGEYWAVPWSATRCEECDATGLAVAS